MSAAAPNTKLERIDIRSLRVSAVVNTAGGGCDANAEHKLRAILKSAQVAPIEVACGGSDCIEANLSRCAGSAIDLLVVVGGDGTIRTAAEKCGNANVLLMPLPGGTMNMLPRALYGEASWEDALVRTLADPHIRPVSGGEVEGHRFFCAGIFGSPSLWAGAREAVREARLVTALRRAVAAYRRMFMRKLYYSFGGHDQGTAEAIAVICPLISAALAPDATLLEAVALDPAGSAEAFRLAWNAVFADWRRDPSVATRRTDRVRVFSGGRVPAILDGEAVTLSRRPEVRFAGKCFAAVTPPAGK